MFVHEIDAVKEVEVRTELVLGRGMNSLLHVLSGYLSLYSELVLKRRYLTLDGRRKASDLVFLFPTAMLLRAQFCVCRYHSQMVMKLVLPIKLCCVWCKLEKDL